MKPRILFVLLLLLVSCDNSNETKIKNLSDSEKQNKPIIVIGTSDDPNALKYFNWNSNNGLFNNNQWKNVKKTNDSLYLKIDLIKQSGIMSILAFGDSSLYRQTMFVTPGDSIFFEIKNKKMEVRGKNFLHYNFFNKFDSLNVFEVTFNGSLKQYKKECQEIYDEQLKHFDEYLKTHKNVSEDFKIHAKGFLDFTYLNHLLFIREKSHGYRKTPLEILQKGLNNDLEGIFDIGDYFEGMGLEGINRPELLNNHSSFKMFASHYIRTVLADPNLENYSSEKFTVEKEFILSNFDGKLEKFLIARLINDYDMFGQTQNLYNLKSLIKEYKHNFSDSSYIKKIDEIEIGLTLMKNAFSDEALNAKLLNLSGDTLTVKEALKFSNKNLKAIDFWASWCAPCINEIMIGVEKRKEISDKNNITWLYFSIDKNKEEWIKKSNELAEYGLLKNQYLILDGIESEITKFLDLKVIPRYVLLDKNGLVINGNAPRPSFDNQFQNTIDNSINP